MGAVNAVVDTPRVEMRGTVIRGHVPETCACGTPSYRFVRFEDVAGFGRAARHRCAACGVEELVRVPQ